MIRIFIVMFALILSHFSTSWAVTASFTPSSAGVTANWDMASLAFTIQGYYGQGATPASWVVDGIPTYQDVSAWFALTSTLRTDGTLEPGGTVGLYGYADAAGITTPQQLFSGTLISKTDVGNTWHFGGTVDTLASPFAGQAGFPSTFDVSLYGDPAWTWDPFQAQPVITFTSESAPVPEPGTWALLLTGMGIIGVGAYRQKRLAARAS